VPQKLPETRPTHYRIPQVVLTETYQCTVANLAAETPQVTSGFTFGGAPLESSFIDLIAAEQAPTQSKARGGVAEAPAFLAARSRVP
jgi:hypothetical protein